MRSVAVIPARYSSSRFPGKPLEKLLGKPMILWVAEISAKALGKENTYIATEDNRIADVIKLAGYEVIMTSKDALTGSDRIAEVAKKIEADIYINVQGDEPLIDPSDIIKIRDAKIKYPDAVINGFSWISEMEDPSSVNIPKVITNEAGKMIYMSRLPLPGFKDEKNAPQKFKKQVCIYAFSRTEILAFRKFGRKSLLEASEDIEILRFLEIGIPVYMIETRAGSYAVDIPADVRVVEEAMKKVYKL
jgi:3-deoxy-manno-octulosonate cytidylyltransferase (CMP-KDO synthetase)